LHDQIDLILLRARGNGHLPGMQAHVPALDTLSSQCPQRRQILSQANGYHNFG
jgi:hypothetical protein